MEHAFAPDFYVVGAAKAGTTALRSWLSAHPDVFLPTTAEPGHFACVGTDPRPADGLFDAQSVLRMTPDARDYAALYAPANGRMTGDCSSVYLHSLDAAQRIAAARPDARIIILLRNPTDRAYAQYRQHIRAGLEPIRDFRAAVYAESNRLKTGWSWAHAYTGASVYAPKIARFQQHFPHEQILFLRHEDLRDRPQVAWVQVLTHLGLSPCPLPARSQTQSPRTQPGPVRRLLNQVVSSQIRAGFVRALAASARPVPPLTLSTRVELSALFAPDLRRTAALTGLDLSDWLRPPAHQACIDQLREHFDGRGPHGTIGQTKFAA